MTIDFFSLSMKIDWSFFHIAPKKWWIDLDTRFCWHFYHLYRTLWTTVSIWLVSFLVEIGCKRGIVAIILRLTGNGWFGSRPEDRGVINWNYIITLDHFDLLFNKMLLGNYLNLFIDVWRDIIIGMRRTWWLPQEWRFWRRIRPIHPEIKRSVILNSVVETCLPFLEFRKRLFISLYLLNVNSL